MKALNTKENCGITIKSIKERKDIFGSNKKSIEQKPMTVKFSFDYWVLTLFGGYQILIDKMVTKGTNERFDWKVGVGILGANVVYALLKSGYTVYSNSQNKNAILSKEKQKTVSDKLLKDHFFRLNA